ncbi:MAG: porin family protein [Ferruginibacter sp.]
MKTVLLSITALMFSGALMAQTATGAGFGVRGGVNLSNITKSGDADFSSNSKLGINAAVFLDLPLSSAIAVQPELQFSQKGYKSSGNIASSPYEYSRTSNFIEVPLLLKLKPAPVFSILVGPQFSFLTSSSTKFSTGNSSVETEVKNDNDNLRKNILGGALGVEATAGGAVFGLRYSLDFQNNNGDGTSTIPKYKNQVTSLYVGFRL